MDIAVYFLYLVCWTCYVYSSTDGELTLQLSDSKCGEAVAYEEIRKLDAKIKEVLPNGGQARLSGHGTIRTLKSKYENPGCYRIKKPVQNKDNILKFEMSLLAAMKQPEKSLQQSLKKSSTIGYLEEACIFTHQFRASEFDSITFDNNGFNCTLNNSRDTFDVASEDMYMRVFDGINYNVSDDISVHYLCNYVVDSSSGLVYRTSYCGLSNNGTLCGSTKHIENNETCDVFGEVPYRRDFDDLYRHINMHVMKKQLGCRHQACPDGVSLRDVIENKFAKVYLRHLMNKCGHTVYYIEPRKQWLQILEIDNRPSRERDREKKRNRNKKQRIMDRCIAVVRDADRLFVETYVCEIPMQHICKRSPNNYTYLNIIAPLIFVVAYVSFTFLMTVKVRTFFKGTRSVNAQHEDGVTSDMHDDGSITRRSGTVSLSSNADDGSDSSDTVTIGGRSSPADDGSVPGRSWTVDVSQPTEGGYVHGRLACGRINAYYSGDSHI